MKTLRTIYFTKIAEQHFGSTMAKIVNTLDQYGPMKYSDIIKYADFDNLKFLEIAITLGIKHQIICYKIQKLYNENDKLIKKTRIIFLNHVALLGREYIPELLATETGISNIIEYALKNGVFGIANLTSGQQNEKQIEEQINQLLDKSLIQIAQPSRTEEKKEETIKNTKNKTEKKILIVINKQEKYNNNEVSLMQLNWTGILNYLKNNAFKLQLKRIYNINNFQDQGVFTQLQMELKKNLEQKWVQEKYTPRHSRIVNLLRIKNCPLDERQICDIALLDYTDSNTILQELLVDSLIKTEIHKVGDKEKQVFLFDQKLIDEAIQSYFYRGMINCRDKKLYFGILNQMELLQFDIKY